MYLQGFLLRDKRREAFLMNEDLLQPCCEVSGDPLEFLELSAMRMPFGKYQGRLLIDLPEPYVVWLANKGFPEGRLGIMLRTVYEIKLNGLEYLFAPLRRGEPRI
jgi:uncharacterized protein (DUF3820 family)